MLCKPLEPDERNVLKGFCYWHCFESLSDSVFLPVNISLSPLLCPPSHPRVSHSVPALPPLHLPAENEWKREANPLWIGVALFSSAFLPFGPLGSVVYWCSSGTSRSDALTLPKRFKNKWEGRKWGIAKGGWVKDWKSSWINVRDW